MTSMFRFGVAEDVTCLADVAPLEPNGAELCLAFKTTTRYFVAGLYVRDDGYVLRQKANPQIYYPLTAEQIGKAQAAGELMTPLPSYPLPFGKYVDGFSLWGVFAFAIIFEIVRRLFVTKRRARLAAARSTTPPSLGPPALVTNGDSFIASQIMPILRAGERVEHQAYGVDSDPSDDLATSKVSSAPPSRRCSRTTASSRSFSRVARIGGST